MCVLFLYFFFLHLQIVCCCCCCCLVEETKYIVKGVLNYMVLTLFRFFWHLWHPWCGGLHVDHDPRFLGVVLRLTLVSSKTMDSTETCFQISWVQEIVPPTSSSKGPQDLIPLQTWIFFHMKLLKVLSSPWSRIYPITVSIQLLGLGYSSKPFSFILGII